MMSSLSPAVLIVVLAGLCLHLFPGALAADPILVEEDHPLLRALEGGDDQGVIGAMEVFMGMAPEEREATIRELMELVSDDPQLVTEMENLLKALPALDEEQLKNAGPGGFHSSLDQMVHDDEVAKAREDAKEMLGGTEWQFFLDNQAVILESVLEAGQLSPEQAAEFKTDETAWLKQLRVIYEDVQRMTQGDEL